MNNTNNQEIKANFYLQNKDDNGNLIDQKLAGIVLSTEENKKYTSNNILVMAIPGSHIVYSKKEVMGDPESDQNVEYIQLQPIVIDNSKQIVGFSLPQSRIIDRWRQDIQVGDLVWYELCADGSKNTVGPQGGPRPFIQVLRSHNFAIQNIGSDKIHKEDIDTLLTDTYITDGFTNAYNYTASALPNSFKEFRDWVKSVSQLASIGNNQQIQTNNIQTQPIGNIQNQAQVIQQVQPNINTGVQQVQQPAVVNTPVVNQQQIQPVVAQQAPQQLPNDAVVVQPQELPATVPQQIQQEILVPQGQVAGQQIVQNVNPANVNNQNGNIVQPQPVQNPQEQNNITPQSNEEVVFNADDYELPD